MTKVIVIKMNGKRIRSYTNADDGRVAYMLSKVYKNPAQIKTMKRTKAKLGFMSFIARMCYIFKATKIAFSKDFDNDYVEV